MYPYGCTQPVDFHRGMMCVEKLCVVENHPFEPLCWYVLLTSFSRFSLSFCLSVFVFVSGCVSSPLYPLRDALSFTDSLEVSQGRFFIILRLAFSASVSSFVVIFSHSLINMDVSIFYSIFRLIRRYLLVHLFCILTAYKRATTIRLN